MRLFVYVTCAVSKWAGRALSLVLAGPWLGAPGFQVVALIVLAGALLDMCVVGPQVCTSHSLARWHGGGNTLPALPWLPGTSEGHRITEVPELPLVAADKVQGYKKPKEAVRPRMTPERCNLLVVRAARTALVPSGTLRRLY